jgi:hypothetical protein
VERPAHERQAAARTAAASVRGASWEQAGETVERIIARTVEAAAGREVAARGRTSTLL